MRNDGNTDSEPEQLKVLIFSHLEIGSVFIYKI